MKSHWYEDCPSNNLNCGATKKQAKKVEKRSEREPAGEEIGKDAAAL